MRFPQIRLTQTWAQIGLNQIKPSQEIEQPKAVMNLHQEPARLTIERTPGMMEIDQRQAWHDQNLKDPFTLNEENSAQARGQALEGIARRVQEGKRLAAIEQGGNPVAQIAKENTTPGPIPYNFGVMPGYGSVSFNFIPAEISINWEQGGAFMEPQTHKPIHEYSPGKVEMYLKQKESLAIDFVGGNLDQIG
ncbi:DUF6470 family protein [Ammoniphilus resinae]|uniref:Uncharacterized protein n=1 Tax=Ammoniphilus resinae TaxID=861532 RepID=A0ABS4GN05_9BACL|nr:DUF6470 family protein [Ammoniphilus resinae]MBP1931497.1 hypothetical protein [Ammoniphilus resinae]